VGRKMSRNITFLKPEHVAPILGLNLRARTIVEGIIAGIHKSPYHGFSAQFLEYKHYYPGESTRYIDWRKYAKINKLMVKQFEDESNLFAWILLDKSASMNFNSQSYMSKYEYAKTLAASLSWILIRQRDPVGLFLFDKKENLIIPPKSTNVQLKTILITLEKSFASLETNCGESISQFSKNIKKRGLCIIISDFFDDVESISKGLRFLKYKKQDIIAIRILDPLENDFNKSGIISLKDMEISKKVVLDGITATEYFNKGIKEHSKKLKDSCNLFGIDFYDIVTDESFAKAILKVLKKRRRMF